MLAIDHSSVYISHYDSTAPIRNADDAFPNNRVFVIITQFRAPRAPLAPIPPISYNAPRRIFTRLDGIDTVEDSSSLDSSESTA